MAVETHPSYHPVKAIPWDLQLHIGMCIEEALYTNALSLLNSLLIANVSDTDASNESKIPVYVPNQLHLIILANLTVHPSTTTRAPDSEKRAAADQALQLLYDLKAIVGPVAAGFDAAFSFGNNSQRRMNRSQLIKAEESQQDDDRSKEVEDWNQKVKGIKAPITGDGNLFSRVADFWQMVGWAFNCAVKYRARWERWKVWLEFILEAMEDDWEERILLAWPNDAVENLSVLESSMVARSITEATQVSTRTARRRIMRAVFADGSAKAMNEFPEVWTNETKELKRDERDVRRKENKVNLDEGNYGDYWDDEDDHPQEITTNRNQGALRRSRNTSKSRNGSPNTPGTPETPGTPPDVQDNINYVGIEAFGGIEALTLRRRILILLLKVAKDYPRILAIAEEMFDVFTETIRPLPLPIFIALLSPTTMGTADDRTIFDPVSQACLAQMLLRPLLAATAPRYRYGLPTQVTMEKAFLPYAANSLNTVDHAKVGILLEILLRLLWRDGQLEHREELCYAIEDGIDARLDKTSKSDRIKSDPVERAEAEAREWLHNSTVRLRMIWELVQTQATLKRSETDM